MKKINSTIDKGLTKVFKRCFFQLINSSEKSSLEFISCSLDKPKFDVNECRQREATLSQLKANLRLVVVRLTRKQH